MLRTPLSSRNTGYVFAFISAALFGSISTLAKPSVESTDPLLLAAIVSAIASIVFTPLTIRRKSPISKIDMKLIIPITVLGAIIAPSLYFVGLKTAAASDAAILSNSEIVFTVLIAIIAFKERLRPLGYASMAIVMIGVVLITTKFDITNLAIDATNPGTILIVLTMLCWAVDNNLSRIATRTVDVSRLVHLKSVIGAAAITGIVLALGIPLEVPQERLFHIILLGVVGFAAPMLLFYLALKSIGTVRTILVFSTSSIFGVIYAAAFLGEHLGTHQIMALCLMLAGLFLLKRSD